MNAYLLVPLSACICCAMLSVVILGRDARHCANRIGAALTVAGGWWALCELLWNGATDAGAALLLVRLSSLGWMLVGPLALHLFLELTGGVDSWHGRSVSFAYAAAALFIGIDVCTPWIHPAVSQTGWGWTYTIGPLFLPAYAVTATTLLAGLALGAREFLASSSAGERRAARWLIVGMLAPLLIGSLTDGIFPMLGVVSPRFGAASVSILMAVVALDFRRRGYSLLAPGDFASEILSTLPDAVALVRLDGRFRSVNECLVRLSGIDARTFESLRLDDVVEGFPEIGDADDTDECEYSLRRADGETIPVAVATAALHDRQGDAIGRVFVARDLREVASLRTRLITSGRLAAVGQLAAGIAHEINNPVTYIRANLGCLRDLLESLGSKLPAALAADLEPDLIEGCALVEESLDGVDRVAGIVRDVKGFSHAGAGTRDLVDLNPLLDAVLRVARPGMRGAVVECNYAEIPLVRAAPQQLKQVFLNLVVNAAHAVEDGEKIRISTSAEGRGVVVRIEDEGCGIASDAIDRIFDPFFTTKPVGEGTGLGLSISYEIVQGHDGEMTVTSTPGRGTLVRVALPAADESAG